MNDLDKPSDFKCKPFLRWPGGKRWLIPTLIPLIANRKINTYIEPFLGGGAVYFSLLPSKAILSDINKELIETYQVVKSTPHHLLSTLEKMPVNRCHYYEIRSEYYKLKVERAARLLYLNRLAFGGMYRVNRQGKFNVPFGGDRTLDILWSANLIVNASKALRSANLYNADFEEVINLASRGDLVYCDPTYTVAHNDNGFQRYNENIFSWTDQERLARACFNAVRRGVYIIMSNASHKTVKELYSPFKPITVERYTGVSRLNKGRRQVKELVFIFNK